MPLGEDGAYAGLLPIAALYAEIADPSKLPETVAALAENTKAALTPEMTIKEIMEALDQTESNDWRSSTRRASRWACCRKPMRHGDMPTNLRRPAET